MSSALLLYDISTADSGGAEPFEVLVTVAGVEGNCGDEGGLSDGSSDIEVSADDGRGDGDDGGRER